MKSWRYIKVFAMTNEYIRSEVLGVIHVTSLLVLLIA